MSTIRVFICAGACCSVLFSASFATADAVDDLLAGKPVVISPTETAEAPAPADQFESDRLLKRLIQRQTHAEEPLSHESFEVKLTEPSQEGLEDSATRAEAPAVWTATAANLNLVPEPSAVILAVLSLAYFLIFFRRRYSF